jgi:TPR repeat protein
MRTLTLVQDSMIIKFSTGLPAFFVAVPAKWYRSARMPMPRLGKQLLAAAALAAGLTMAAPPTLAGYDEGFTARQRGDFATALREFAAAAEAGDARAQFALGAMYRNGEGVPPDAAVAANWYRRAAQQGHLEAQYNLGLLYRNGTGVTKDDAVAATWYIQAARQGHAQAQYNLAVMYQIGAGVQADLTEAFAWLTVAALQGQVGAEAALGRIGVQLNPQQTAAAERKAEQYIEQYLRRPAAAAAGAAPGAAQGPATPARN